MKELRNTIHDPRPMIHDARDTISVHGSRATMCAMCDTMCDMCDTKKKCVTLRNLKMSHTLSLTFMSLEQCVTLRGCVTRFFILVHI